MAIPLYKRLISSATDGVMRIVQLAALCIVLILIGWAVVTFLHRADEDAQGSPAPAKKKKTAAPAANANTQKTEKTEPSQTKTAPQATPDYKPPVEVKKRQKIPQELADSIRDRFFGLPSYYRHAYLKDDELWRLDAILKAPDVTDDDLDFLKFKVMGGAVATAEQEIEHFKKKIEELTETTKRPKNPEFDAKLKEAEGDAKKLYDCALWCRSKKLKPHEALAMYKILQIDPGYDPARHAIGFASGTGAEAHDQEILVSFEGRQLTEYQLRNRLIELGYAEVGGKWQKKEDWSFVLDTVHKPETLHWSSTDITIQDAKEEAISVTGKSMDESQRTLTQKAVHKFFAPSGSAGTLKIVVEAPQPIYEAKLRAPARASETKGSVEMLVGESKPVRVYFCDKGFNDQTYDISDKVRGQNKIVLTVVMKADPDRMMQHARFLPSAAESKAIFSIRGSVMTPAPEMDQLFEPFRRK